MRVLHLTSVAGWRGGERQLALLVSNLPAPIESVVAAPEKSSVFLHLPSSVPTETIACNGFFDMRSVWAVRRLLKRRGIDLIHAHTSKAQEVALLARLGTGIPVVVSRRVAFPVSGGWKYRSVDRWSAVSNAAAMELRKAGVAEERITVIYDAVDAQVLEQAKADRLDATSNEIVVLCAAALSPEKDHDMLLKAWRLVEDSAPMARLNIAGDGKLREKVLAGIAGHGLSTAHFLGWRTDIPSLLKGADIVTLSSRQEGFSSILCDAQMARKPVAATRAGGISEAVQDGATGLLSEVGDALGLAKNLLRLIDDASLRRRLGENGHIWARENFNAAAIAEKYADLYFSERN